uniref:J domain-containing protein n=1 Tax=Nelumbo nucifera TaxID=4432 RepID=A0A822Z871_NELNU|nr:TPA_asm: hypothetical protein HUJ06_008330 [Nelumbo nucifera]
MVTMVAPAVRCALDAAEERFKAQDVEGAIKHANAAKQLHPHPEAIDQLLAAYNVHLVATKKRKRNGDMDWYALLNIADSASADTETIKRQYKRMSLMVHPDKNSSVAAEGAFKLISEAWSVLSQPTKRRKYDLRSGTYAHARSTPSAAAEASGSSFPTTTSAASTVEIKPCPCCSKPVSHEKANNGVFSIVCRDCGFRFKYVSSEFYEWSTSKRKPVTFSFTTDEGKEIKIRTF